MEWYAWVAWIVATGTGVYGAWRAWRTDRRLSLTTAKWSVTHFQNSAFLLSSHLHYRADDVTLELPVGMMDGGRKVAGVSIAPTESVKFTAFRSGASRDDDAVVKWRRGKRQFTVRVIVPPESSP